MSDDDLISSVSQFRKFAIAVCIIGVAVQLGLTAYYLSVGHKAAPHHMPVGLVSPEAKRGQVVAFLQQDGAYTVSDYATPQGLTAAIKRREVYGGVDITNAQPRLYLAGAAGPAAANLLKGTFTGVVQQQDANTLAQLAATQEMITVGQAEAITAPPLITDVVPLPAEDVNGASLGLLTQALALGGTIASIGLGRLIPRTRRSWRRGAGHLTALIVYAVGSAAAVLWSMTWFGVGAAANHGELFGIFALVSLAITASTAGAVALIGPAGALVGGLYFTVGTVISGAGILPEFLPAFGRAVGEILPTGAGALAVRGNLYFPDAPIGRHLLVLVLCAVLGCLVVLVTNLLPNHGNRTCEVELDLVARLEGAEHREPVEL